MRLDRFLSHAGGLTRSQAQRAIRAGGVRVAGAVVTDPGAHIDAHSAVEFAGRRIEERKPRYLMLNKPAGYVCATQDPDHRTVLDLLDAKAPDGLHAGGTPPPASMQSSRGTRASLHIGRSQLPASRGTRASLHIAGRLDIDATGLVLVTDDGDWSHRVTSPRHKVPKTYRVTLAAPLDDEAAATLRAGVRLRNEARRCAPVALEQLADSTWRVTITEGKYHQLKRMFAAVGNHVVALHRERIGALVLDPNLAPGAYRPLTAEEIATFRHSAP